MVAAGRLRGSTFEADGKPAGLPAAEHGFRDLDARGLPDPTLEDLPDVASGTLAVCGRDVLRCILQNGAKTVPVGGLQSLGVAGVFEID